jgi:Amt family ammonium transporter
MVRAMNAKPIPTTLAVLALALAPTLARAQDLAADAVDSGDTAFVLVSSLLAIVLIVAGVVLHHGGQGRARAFAGLATEIVAIAAVVMLLWVMVGYTLAFGAVSSGWLGGGNAWMLLDLGNVRGASAVPEVVFVLLQLGFAVLAATMLTGGWAERGNLAWVVPFAGLWSLLVYAPLAHWVWGGGWLATRLGTVDYGGALGVHASVGISALVITLLIGRRERFAGPANVPGHAPALALAGTAMVWVAMIALTAAATLAASDDAGTTALDLLVATAAGALGWLLIAAMTQGGAGPKALARGGLAGLVAASAAAGAMAPGGAMVAGLTGALLAWIAARLIRAAAIDDAIDAVAVHGVGGLAGAMLAAPLIAGTLGGTGYAAGMGPVRQIIAQAVAAGAVVAWSAIGTAIAALMVAMVVPMRISAEDETGAAGK